MSVHAADCHAHIFGGAQYPFAENLVYRPEPSQMGTVSDFLAVLDAHQMTTACWSPRSPTATTIAACSTASRPRADGSRASRW